MLRAIRDLRQWRQNRDQDQPRVPAHSDNGSTVVSLTLPYHHDIVYIVIDTSIGSAIEKS
jgi:hypothetical protein